MIAYFDASAFIYLIESNEPFASKVRKELAAITTKFPDLATVLTRLSWLECRVRPMKSNDSATLLSRWLKLTRDVIELAAVIRVKHGLPTPDALQVASFLQLGKNHLFLSGDAAFSRVNGLNVKLLT